ncbi:SMP-30/gluconolactonase/LRE family protein [Sphingomonas sp. R-74633]|uniref:SMP-30/gluconolactonase/LRE family protein n=1 Tax=Sphingomonas sp. R-74633 TaxID=2751188 RepID=UPI0015D20C9F|nr:SMP-30/gluconolactonase/LRE family protein [Sphingomonas sp. R-74633]NYT42146.1 SMP-30/gluconolactonase/LRE family protein [Sphingomonas sp. R-74633]
MGVVTSAPESVWSLAAPLLEGPVWVARDAALWFVCIKTHKVFRYDPARGDKRSWDAPAQVGFVLPAERGGFIAGLQTGLARFDPEDGSFTPLVDPEPHLPGNRLNDSTVDPAGRLWLGTMDDSEADDSGAIYRLAGDGSCRASSPPCSITNGPAVSPDGATLYHIDTLGGLIYACDLGEDGALTNRRVFARIPNEEGYPDGPTVDAEGCLWVGLYKGSAVRRYSPGGDLLEAVPFPVDAITKIAFGGPDLKTVYATTANKHLSPEEKAENPTAGDLFRFTVSVPGVAGTLIREGC